MAVYVLEGNSGSSVEGAWEGAGLVTAGCVSDPGEMTALGLELWCVQRAVQIRELRGEP